MLKILATFRGKLTDVSIPSSPQSFRLSGAVLAIGSFILLIGTLLYLPLGPTLGLPTNQSAYPDAFNTALHMGRMMQLAGCISFLGDTLILVASLALLGRRELAHGDFERICWSLLGVGF